MEAIAAFLKHQPEIALFLSLAIGYLVGSIRLGPVQLGGVCGTLLVALLLGQTGVHLDDHLKNIAFALFIFSLGFTGGPQFFSQLKSMWTYGLLSIIEVVTTLTLVLIAMRLLTLDPGTTAGLLAGSATESAVIGTASEALNRLHAAPDVLQQYQSNVVTAYSVTYLFGLITITLFTSQIAPWLMHINLQEEASKLLKKLGGSGAQGEAMTAAPELVARTLRIDTDNVIVGELEAKFDFAVTIERVMRDNSALPVSAATTLHRGDQILLAGRRTAVVGAASVFGTEIQAESALDPSLHSAEVLLTLRDVEGTTIQSLRETADPVLRHGIYIAGIQRMEHPVPAVDGAVLHRGDVLTLQGLSASLGKAVKKLGYLVTPTIKTDFIYLGIGVTIGILLGRISVPLGKISVTLGTGGGCLLSGLAFGWLRARAPIFGSFPPAASQILKDLGLSIFIAAVGFSSGSDAVKLIREHGLALPVFGIAVSLVPALISLFVGRRFLKFEPPLLLGAIAGQQCSTPAISSLVTAAGNATPVIGYTVTYAISNVLLPLAGPVLVGLTTLLSPHR